MSSSLYAGVLLGGPDRPIRWKDGVLVLHLSRNVHVPGGAGGVLPEESAADVHRALEAAIRGWTAAGRGAVTIQTEMTDSETASANTVTFTDSSPFDQGACDRSSAAACALLSWDPATREMTGASIAFNPYLRHSALGRPGALDITRVMMHELGHALGLDHSGLTDSVMHSEIHRAGGSAGDFSLRTLSPGDRLSLAHIYPPPGPALSRIAGSVAVDGALIEGAHVVAVDQAGAPVFDTLTDAGGRYILTVEPGSYTVLARPPDGLVPAQKDLRLAGPFPLFAQAGIEAGSGASVEAPLEGPGGPGSRIDWVAVIDAESRYQGALEAVLPRGGAYRVLLHRSPAAQDPEVSFSSPAVRLTAAPQPVSNIAGWPGSMLLRVTVASDAPAGNYMISCRDRDSNAVLPGGVRVVVNPQLAEAVDAETGERREFFRPGQLLLLRGSDLADRQEKAFQGQSQLRGIVVRSAGRDLLLLSVAPDAILLRLPGDARSGKTELRVVSGPGTASNPLAIEIREE